MEQQKQPEEQKEGKIIPRVIEDEMKSSYLDYSMSVIVGRALPDIRDGLKPVHRRILYAMYKMGMIHNKPFKKSARIVGEVLGKYHPHGDMAVYDAMVRMVQDFSLRYPLVQGQGNFGSIDGDNAAAMRYCVTGNTLVLTDKGILPIKNISNKKEAKINIKILSYNSKKNSASKLFNSGKHNIIKLRTYLGYEIQGSYDHPVMCWTLRDNALRIEWKLLKDINKNDIVLLNRNSSLFSNNDLELSKFKPKSARRTKKIGLPSRMNKELAFLLGSLVSEGSFHQNKIYFSNSDMQFYTYVKDIIYNQFNGVRLYERKIAGKCLELNIYHKHVVEFLKNIGLNEKKSDKKEIPFSVLQSSKGVLAEFLRGLFEGDGCVRYKTDKRHNGKSIELTYNSKSANLIEQLKIVLLNFGIVTTSPYKDKRNACYKLIISGCSSIKKFKNEINFFSERKKSIITNIDNMNSSRMSKTDFIPYLNSYLRAKYSSEFILKNNFDRYNNLEKKYERLVRIIDGKDKRLVDFILKQKYLFNKVTKKTKLNKKEVYSIKVNSNCHSFIANGFINHNTEARLRRIAEEMLQDIDKNTVKFTPNFDGSLKEPSLLPAKIPNLLVNGSSGIAVGMATNIPPHNIVEICDGTIKLIDNPELTVDELMKIITAPDFPTGATICGTAGIHEAYRTGRGKLKVRARTKTEESKSRTSIIVTEIPYQVNKSLLISEIAALVREKKVQGIVDIRDESDREGMRIVIDLKQGANQDIVLNQLYKHTNLQTTFGVIMLGILDNEPKVFNLKQMISQFIKHRQGVVRKRTKFELNNAEERAHILEGIIIALNNVDAVIKLIKESKTVESAKAALGTSYKMTGKQSQAVLEMRLQRLTSLEQQKVKKEHEELIKLIKELKEILASEQKILGIIKKELEEIKQKYGDERRTQVTAGEETEIDMEDLIKPEEMVVTVSHAGYIKRIPLSTYKEQKRGGKGIIAAGKKDEDFIEELFIANTHSYLLFFTNLGKVHWLKVYKIPEAARQAKGTAIINLLQLDNNEKVTAYVPVKEFKKDRFITMATKNGVVKRTSLDNFSNPRRGGILALGLNKKDELISARLTNGNTNLIMATANGMAVRFMETDIRPMGRTAVGVRGIKLRNDDRVIGMVRANENKTLLTVTGNGFGKRTPITDYRVIKRGGVGVINIKITNKNGQVSSIKSVTDEDGLMFITKNGITIRIAAKDISVIGRNTQGVRVMRLAPGDMLAAAAKVPRDDENGNNK